ncbi:hypothetical protein FRC11_011344, partial [Ceratobasidium sp. 423]
MPFQAHVTVLVQPSRHCILANFSKKAPLSMILATIHDYFDICGLSLPTGALVDLKGDDLNTKLGAVDGDGKCKAIVDEKIKFKVGMKLVLQVYGELQPKK